MIVNHVVSVSNKIAINGTVMCIPIKDVVQNIGFKISISKNPLSMMDTAFENVDFV